jgi:CRISPR-associated endonuclease/helicase Cas3
MVTFRNAVTATALEEDVRRELARLEISGTAHLVPSTRPAFAGQPLRRVLRIGGKRVVGFAVRVTGLTPQESLLLQEVGVGGRRRMGCGVFSPTKWGGSD